jgi:hypothetical protein
MLGQFALHVVGAVSTAAVPTNVAGSWGTPLHRVNKHQCDRMATRQLTATQMSESNRTDSRLCRKRADVMVQDKTLFSLLGPNVVPITTPMSMAVLLPRLMFRSCPNPCFTSGLLLLACCYPVAT